MLSTLYDVLLTIQYTSRRELLLFILVLDVLFMVTLINTKSIQTFQYLFVLPSGCYTFLVCEESGICGIKKIVERDDESGIDDFHALYCRTITAVGHRSLGFPSARKFTRKGKAVSLLVIRSDIKRSQGRETIPVHRTAIKTVISGRIAVCMNVTRDFRASQFCFM